MCQAVLERRTGGEGIRRSCRKWSLKVTPEGQQWACGSARHERVVGSGQHTRADLRDGAAADGARGRRE